MRDTTSGGRGWKHQTEGSPEEMNVEGDTKWAGGWQGRPCPETQTCGAGRLHQDM